MAEVLINGKIVTVEPGDDGYWYYRDSYNQNFGKKVKLSGDHLLVWNSARSIIEGEAVYDVNGNYVGPEFGTPGPDGGDGSSYAVVAAFSSSPLSGDAPLEVQFTDESTGPVTTYAWDFNNDGTVDSTEANPLYTYPDAGIYDVKLTVSNNINSDIITKINHIEAIAVDWSDYIEPVLGLNNTTSGVYLEIDDFVPNSNTLIVEMDYEADPSKTSINYHGVVYDGVYMGHWQSNGTRWYFGIGNGSTYSGFTFARHKQTINVATEELFIDDVLKGLHSSPLDLSGCTRNFHIWKAIEGTTGNDSTTNCYAKVYAFRVWDAGVMIHQLLATPSGETHYNASSAAPSNCFWDTVSERYYESSADALTIVNV